MAETSITLNLPPAKRLRPRRTYVVFGLERGGTSAVAGIARALGLWIGDDLGGNNEDQAFHARRLAGLRKAIKVRNQERDIWGFKYPTIGAQLPALVENLRNPHFIVVYRDPVATAMSRDKWDGPGLRRRIDLAVHEANAVTNANTGFALASGHPTLLVSNERGLAKPGALIDEVAAFLGTDVPGKKLRKSILDYLEPGSYKAFDEHFTVPEPSGTVDPKQPITSTPKGATR